CGEMTKTQRPKTKEDYGNAHVYCWLEWLASAAMRRVFYYCLVGIDGDWD
ncbi:unnamed protein product, partial [Onchocerca ochengi]